MMEKKNLVIVIIIIFLFLIGVSLMIIFGNESTGKKSVSNRRTFVDSNQNVEIDEEVVNDKFNEDDEINEEEKLDKDQYPSLTEETMDRNLVLSCEGGDEVVFWDLPTSASNGARMRDRISCGTFCWAFNEYYDKENDLTWYAVQTIEAEDSGLFGSRPYGWVTEDLITWRD